MLEYLPIVAIALAATSLVVTIVIGIRTGNIFPAKLEFHFSDSPTLPKSVRKTRGHTPPVAIAFCNSRLTVAASTIRLPLFVRNASGKKIDHVTIALTYPAAYFIHNEEHEGAIEEALKQFPERARDLRQIPRQLAMRECLVIGELVTLRYNVGLLRAGESFSCEEMLRFPKRGRAFHDARFSDRMFGTILEKLRELPQLLGVCHVHASILSDSMRPIRRCITVINAHGKLENAQTEILNPFADAHWLNAMPRGESFRRIVPHSPWKRPPRPVEESFVDLRSNSGKFEIASDGNVVLVSHWLDGIEMRGSSVMQMPGYDYFRLPRRVDSVDWALRSIGYQRVRERNVSPSTP